MRSTQRKRKARVAAMAIGVAMRVLLFAALAVVIAELAFAGDECSGTTKSYRATGYAVKHRKTAGGTRPKEGAVAADPKLLPLGSKIRVCEAGDFSGVYVVTDKGRKIHGAKLDLFFESAREAKRFGKRTLKVAVLEHGEGTQAAAKAEPAPPPQEKAPAMR